MVKEHENREGNVKSFKYYIYILFLEHFKESLMHESLYMIFFMCIEFF